MARELSEISKFVSSYWNYYVELEEAFRQTQKYVAFDKNPYLHSVANLRYNQASNRSIEVPTDAAIQQPQVTKKDTVG